MPADQQKSCQPEHRALTKKLEKKRNFLRIANKFRPRGYFLRWLIGGMCVAYAFGGFVFLFYLFEAHKWNLISVLEYVVRVWWPSPVIEETTKTIIEVFVAALMFFHPKNIYDRLYRKAALPEIARGMENLSFDPNAAQSAEIFEQFRFIPAHDDYKSGGVFTSTDHGFEICILSARYKDGHDRYNEYNRYKEQHQDINALEHPMFPGLLILVKFPHTEMRPGPKFNGSTVITTDPLWKLYDARNTASKPSLKKVDFPTATKFEQHFNVLSNDSAEAHYICAPETLGKFVELEEIFDGAKVTASFQDQYMRIVLPERDFLESDLDTPAIEQIEQCRKKLKLILSLAALKMGDE